MDLVVAGDRDRFRDVRGVAGIDPGGDEPQRWMAGGAPVGAALLGGLWLLFRLVGYVVIAPLAEELAFRGFLTRRIVQPDFQNVPLGMFSWSSFLISSVLFGAFHGGMWLAGTLAGMSFALALYHRRALGDAVQAHAIPMA
jgi:CAAX prenyl protease-related protein